MIKGIITIIMSVSSVSYHPGVYGVCSCDVLNDSNKECRIEDIGIMGAKGQGGLVAVLNKDKALSQAKVKITCRRPTDTFKDPFRRPR